MNKNSEIFVINITALKTIYIDGMIVYFSQTALIALLQWNKASTQIFAKYADYADIFIFDLIIELPKNTDNNNHTMKHLKLSNHNTALFISLVS